MYRYIQVNENGKITRVHTSSNPVNDNSLIESPTGDVRQLMLEDGTFIDDENDYADKEEALKLVVKNETFEEYKKMSEIYGSNSIQAATAKQDFIDASNNIKVKCRYELKTELLQAEEDAEMYMAIYLDSEGAW